MHADQSGIDEILLLVIGGAFTALHMPGYGFLEKAYALFDFGVDQSGNRPDFRQRINRSLPAEAAPDGPW